MYLTTRLAAHITTTI